MFFEWINESIFHLTDSLIKRVVACFVPEWISIFLNHRLNERFNDSLIKIAMLLPWKPWLAGLGVFVWGWSWNLQEGSSSVKCPIHRFSFQHPFFFLAFSMRTSVEPTADFYPRVKAALLYIYIYAFSRRFYPKRLTLHSSYSFTFYQLRYFMNMWEDHKGLRCYLGQGMSVVLFVN